MSGILRLHVKTLRLRADAPWPSQILARQRYRMKARKTVKYSDSPHATALAGEHATRIDISQIGTPESQ